jgi:hypothetical protein
MIVLKMFKPHGPRKDTGDFNKEVSNKSISESEFDKSVKSAASDYLRTSGWGKPSANSIRVEDAPLDVQVAYYEMLLKNRQNSTEGKGTILQHGPIYVTHFVTKIQSEDGSGYSSKAVLRDESGRELGFADGLGRGSEFFSTRTNIHATPVITKAVRDPETRIQSLKKQLSEAELNVFEEGPATKREYDEFLMKFKDARKRAKDKERDEKKARDRWFGRTP